jgi:hypothetical protein
MGDDDDEVGNFSFASFGGGRKDSPAPASMPLPGAPRALAVDGPPSKRGRGRVGGVRAFAAPVAHAAAEAPKTSGGGGASAAGKAKARGRPKEDPSIKVRAEVESFAKVPDDPMNANYRKFLGDEFRAKERQLKELQKCMDKVIETTEEVELYDVLALDKKRLQALMMVTGAFAKNSGFEVGSDFLHTFNEVRQFVELRSHIT